MQNHEVFLDEILGAASDSILCILERSSNDEARQKDKSVCINYFVTSP